MKKKIATLEVWLETEHPGPSRSGWNNETKEGIIELRAVSDSFPIQSKEDLADVFAHELGHFVGNVLQLPAQIRAAHDSWLTHAMGIPLKSVYEGEKTAWELAGKMRKINPKNRDPRLKSYLEE